MKMTSPTSSATFDDYHSQTDMAEVQRLQALAGMGGYGDSLTDEESQEMAMTLEELGIQGVQADDQYGR